MSNGNSKFIFKNALTAIWTYKPEGWWHYDDEYVKYNICTKEDILNRYKQL